MQHNKILSAGVPELTKEVSPAVRLVGDAKSPPPNYNSIDQRRVQKPLKKKTRKKTELRYDHGAEKVSRVDTACGQHK